MIAFSDAAVGGGGVVDGKVEKDEVGIIGDGRRARPSTLVRIRKIGRVRFYNNKNINPFPPWYPF